MSLPHTRSESGGGGGGGAGVYIYIYIYERIAIYVCLWMKKYLNRTLRSTHLCSRTSRRIYRLALPLCAPEMLSSLSKSRISIFNVHLTLNVHRMTSHNSIGKNRHLVN